ncbi:MAG: pantothenate kinase [Gammaproteobacteria bacterium]|nr:pantothenate kinase [Gammaproteobacteria bacterium]
MKVAIDFGISNTDIAISNGTNVDFFTLPSKKIDHSMLDEIFNHLNIDVKDVDMIAVTGGKSDSLESIYKNIEVIKINETDAIGNGVIEIYSTHEPFLAISAGTGTACIHHQNGEFNYIGGIAIGGGTLGGLSNLALNNLSIDEVTKKAIVGHRDNVDLLIGDVVNDIGVLDSSVTASNFAKLKKADDASEDDIAAAILNMIGEVIGTIAYLNAALCGLNTVHFIGRVSTNEYIKNAIDERLKLVNMQGIFEDNREYGTVIGALKHITTN